MDISLAAFSFEDRAYHFEGEAEEENGVDSSSITTWVLLIFIGVWCITGCWNKESEASVGLWITISSCCGIITYSSLLLDLNLL